MLYDCFRILPATQSLYRLLFSRLFRLGCLTMIQLPPGFDFRQFLSELATLGAFFVSAYAVIAVGDVILGILRRGKDA